MKSVSALSNSTPRDVSQCNYFLHLSLLSAVRVTRAPMATKATPTASLSTASVFPLGSIMLAHDLCGVSWGKKKNHISANQDIPSSLNDTQKKKKNS